ncbi:magnesium transporter [Agrococcus casei]|uniref:Magnesium transporter MgtE n=1 Tax=Agrococcus casei LMG 22410 TaxID=1255656 RepID=A0A1R4F8Q8_9MICO|nr:magnesium transporter [Agrococcus casei]SJM52360.1 Mg/Co/Ni transporter MgtE / CBS domain [Agrococcus casei LMG 22410]
MSDPQFFEKTPTESLVIGDLSEATVQLGALSTHETADLLERVSTRRAAVLFRLLGKDQAAAVFDALEPPIQADLITSLCEDEVGTLFESLDPDDRAKLVDEVPAAVATRLISGLSAEERSHTNAVLGYPAGTIGRRMSPHFVSVHPHDTAETALAKARALDDTAETVYTMLVTDTGRTLAGVVSLREVLMSDPSVPIADLMQEADSVRATDDAEAAALALVDRAHLLVPVTDSEHHVLGILTLDDAAQILRDEADEDAARAGGAEPLRRPYLSTSVLRIARSRVVWLLVLAVSGLLTVQVLEIFETTLEQAVVLAMFIPLLTGIGGNTGSQAASTVTRALAVGDVRTRDVGLVLLREVRVGLVLGVLMGALGFVLATLVYDMPTGVVIGLTIVCICAMAASVGGAMPLLAKAIKVDPAVFSTPFITTFCDATGLIIYFSIAKAVLGI